jgi:Caspase domain
MDPARDALIVATADYHDPKLQQLRAPVADAHALARVLEDQSIGGFDVQLALDEDESVLTRRLARFFSDRRPDDLLLLHFSCHGIKDASGELYMAAADTETDLLSATGIPSRWLSEQIGKCRSKRIVVLLDCCFSGSFPFGTHYRAGESVHVQQHLDGRGRVVITASNAMEYSFEGDQLSGAGRPSIFTASVVAGLESGEADQDGDRLVSVDELYEYVYDRVREATPNQTPTKLSSLEGPLYIARSNYERPVEPAPLPQELVALGHHPYAEARLGAVAELERLLGNSSRGLQLSARLMLESMLKDDSRKVSDRVRKVLAAQAEPSAAGPPDHEPPGREPSAPEAAVADVAARRVMGPEPSPALAAVATQSGAAEAPTRPDPATKPTPAPPPPKAEAAARPDSMPGRTRTSMSGRLGSQLERDGHRIAIVGGAGTVACAIAALLAAVLSWSVFKSAGYLGNGTAVAAFAIGVAPIVIALMAVGVWARASAWSPGPGFTGILLGTAVPALVGLIHYPVPARLYTVGVYALAGVGIGLASTILRREMPLIVVGIAVGIVAGAVAGALSPLPPITHHGAWIAAQVLGGVISSAPLCVLIAMLPQVAHPTASPPSG